MRTSYKIPRAQATKILARAIAVSKDVKADQLDCSKSFSRIPTRLSVKSVLKAGLESSNTLFHFIYRDQSFLPQEFLDADGGKLNRDYWDVGLSTSGHSPELFLWIRLEVEDGLVIVEEFNLQSS